MLLRDGLSPLARPRVRIASRPAHPATRFDGSHAARWRAQRRLGSCLVLLLSLAACDGDRPAPDLPPTMTAEDPAAAADAGPPVIVDAAPSAPQAEAAVGLDAGPPVAAPPPASPPLAFPDAALPPLVINCLTPDSDIKCDDGAFCNGVELCSPSDARADARGCVPGQALACTVAGETCSEQRRMCSACSDTALDDDDGDGHESQACGGGDCRDDDALVHPGAPDTCDGRDNDCDGAVDGAYAEQACSAMAPSGAVSTCTSGACAVRCTDPDFDLVGGVCVRHDDCAGVTACAPGSCVDGVRAHTCACPAGYAGTGTPACADVDECATPSAHTCDTSPLACINTPGSFRCECPATHFGSASGAQGCARKAVAVSAGYRHTCAVLAGGKVKCWGSDAFGKLGLGGTSEMPHGGAPGQMGDALPYVQLGAGRSATAVASGSDVTCSALDDGRVKCWGYNGYGAVGAPRPDSFGITESFAPTPAGRKCGAVAAGSGLGFALLDDGSLGRWGQSFVPYPMGAGQRVKSFDRSPRYDGYHLCAVLDAGAVRCWPADQFVQDLGQFGWAYNPALPPESYPNIALGTGRTATAVALGDTHSCALLDDGAVKCWGANDKGQLGVGDTFARGAAAADMGDALPAVALGGVAKAISAGAQHTCALLDGGTVKCWGFNDAGQLGQGHTRSIGDEPGELAALPAIDLGGKKAIAIDVGAHSCAVLETGAIKCWGTNGYGELGLGDLVSRGALPGSMGAALREIDLGE
jgi:hypothetical protein